jgi:two-component system phosphate regulon sensor histidine kinase PhoR
MVKSNDKAMADLITSHQQTLLADWREKVRLLPSAKDLDKPTLEDEIPQLLKAIAATLFNRALHVDVAEESTEHGVIRWQEAFDVMEVVEEYNILRHCLQRLAEQNGISFSGDTARIVNDALDHAIGRAIKAFETVMTIELQRQHEEHIGFLLHDLRSPLEAISLATRLLDHSVGRRDPTVDKVIEILRGNVTRIDDQLKLVLIREKGIGHTIPPEFKSLELKNEVDRVISNLSPIADSKALEIRNEIPADLTVRSETRLLAQIIQNLLSNALKFTDHGGIVIRARHQPEVGGVECWVTDTGEGIAAERLDRIFDRFETDERLGKRGMGLGLAIVKEIVELHRGEIHVQSTLGEGTVFKFTLPDPSSFHQ